jgi:hypothetical protein
VDFVRKMGEALGRLVKFLIQVRLGGDRVESDDR